MPPVTLKPYLYLLIFIGLQATFNNGYCAELIGKVVSKHPQNVVSQISGVIVQTHWQVGDKLTRGELLASIKAKDFTLTLKKQQANLALVTADLKIKKSVYHRYQALRGKNSISQHELEVAKANLEAAQASLTLAKTGLEKAQLDVNYTQIHTPIAGYITAQATENGAWVNQGDLLYQLVNIDRINIRLLASEFDLHALTIGQAIQIWAEANPTHKVTTNIKRIGVELDSQLLAYPVEIELDNIDHSFKPGMSIHATTHFQDAQ